MNQLQSGTNSLALDGRSLDTLRAQAKRNPDQALKAVSIQFEAVFLQALLKSMRDATPQDGMMDSDSTRMYTSMLDQQMAQSLSARGIGLADVMLRQLRRTHQADTAAAPALAPTSLNPSPTHASGLNQQSAQSLSTCDIGLANVALRQLQRAHQADVGKSLALTSAAQSAPPDIVTHSAVTSPVRIPLMPMPTELPPAPVDAIARASGSSSDFLSRVKTHVLEAANATGIPAQFLLGQAALESGWGKREIRAADGSPSYNVFGIKAGRNWNGATVDVMTTEYTAGVPRKTVQKFRAYASYAEAFQNYANMLRGNPRYAAVLKQSDGARFAQGLQRAGYATDPRYAEKLTQVLNGARLRQVFLT